MGRSLANYIYLCLDRMVDITPEMEAKLNRLFDIWDAKSISVEDFRAQHGFEEDASVYYLIPYMTEHAAEKLHCYLEPKSYSIQILYFLKNILYNLNCINQLLINEEVIIKSYRDLVVGGN